MSHHRPGFCSTGKMRFPTRREARARLSRLRRRPQTDASLRPYRCGECGWWHLGRRPPIDVLEHLRARER